MVGVEDEEFGQRVAAVIILKQAVIAPGIGVYLILLILDSGTAILND